MAIENNDPGKNLGIVALILGIASFVFCWVPILPVATGIAGIIVAVKSSKASKEAGAPTTLATVGLVFSIIGLAFGALYTIFCWGCVMIAACLAEGTVNDGLADWASTLASYTSY
jgi:hypothetical protein